MWGAVWSVLKFFVVMALLVAALVYAGTHISPKTFEWNTTRVCASTVHDQGLCAGRFIAKGESIGLVTTLQSATQFRDSVQGKYLNHAAAAAKPNIDFVPLYRGGTIDVYGYANRDIDEGLELTADFTSTYAPKPNTADAGDNAALFAAPAPKN